MPIEVLAQRADLWSERRWEMGGDMAVMTLGQRHPTPDDPMQGSHIVLYGPKPADRSEASFVPVAWFALGRHAGDLAGLPALPDAKAARDAKVLGGVAFTVSIPLERDAVETALQKIEIVCGTMSAGDRFVGYALGDLPTDAAAPLYKGLKKLVLTHLGQR